MNEIAENQKIYKKIEQFVIVSYRDRTESVGINTTFAHLAKWNDPVANGHPYLTTAILQSAAMDKSIAIFVKSEQ